MSFDNPLGQVIRNFDLELAATIAQHDIAVNHTMMMCVNAPSLVALTTHPSCGGWISCFETSRSEEPNLS